MSLIGTGPNTRSNDKAVINYRRAFAVQKTTAIRSTAVRQTGVFRHRGGPFEDPHETPRTVTALSY